ncbi:MAG: hypothetical protein HY905_23170 [Deltaproteobacteria bacterium]|nr:hypothetical protein [Deltaproteobacteria bacterium]
MGRGWIIWFAAGRALLLSPGAAAEPGAGIAVVATGSADEAAAAEFAGILDQAVTRRHPEAPRNTDAVMRQAGAEWPEPYVVVFDVERAVVRVLRPEDGMVLYRPLDPPVARQEPYAVALAAAELLDLAATTPLAEAAAVAPPPATERRAEVPRWALGVVAGGTSVVGLGGELAVIQPSFGVEVLLDRRRGPWFGALSLQAGVWSFQERSVAGAAGGDAAAVELQRHDLVLDAALGRGIGPAALLLSVELGFAFSSYTVRNSSARRVDDALQVAGWLGVAVAVRLDVGAGFFVQTGTGLAWSPDAESFRIGSVPVFDAGDVQLRGSLMLGWNSG